MLWVRPASSRTSSSIPHHSKHVPRARQNFSGNDGDRFGEGFAGPKLARGQSYARSKLRPSTAEINCLETDGLMRSPLMSADRPRKWTCATC
ncbi:hypothetical protein MRX96_036102 [Rhipicephalus microplus]